MKADWFARSESLTLPWFLGVIALAGVTWAGFQLGLDLTTAGLAYLIVIVMLSLIGSFVSSVIFSVAAVGCLCFFFAKPLFSFRVEASEDLSSLAALLITSLVITILVKRVHRFGDAQREQARLLNLTRDTVFVRDVNDVITYWNRGAEELYGWNRTEAIGKVTHQLLQTRFPMPLDQIMEALLRTGRWEGELVHTKRDGAEVVVASRWSLQRNERGQPFGTLETNNDVTERKRAEEALHRLAAYLAEAQKLSLTGSFGWNVSSGELFWSEQSFRIFEYDSGTNPTIEMVFQRVHPDDGALVRKVLDRAASTRQDFDFEHRLLMLDGSVKHLHVVAHTVSSEAGNPQFVGAIMDVTAAKLAEEQLRQAQMELAHVTRVTALGELSASVAHEVGQPLAAIVTSGDACLRWLDRKTPQLDEVRACVQLMKSEGTRASEIVLRIRSLTKRTTPQKTRLELNDVVNDVVSLVQREVSNHQVLLRLNLAPELPALLGDRVQLQQVIINLVINGIQAMAGIRDRPRELLIESRRAENGNVIVAVQDSGTGIDSANADRLFDTFFTTKPNGMGMGLSISRSIIEAHGGRMWASSNAGHGAIFQFSLPSIGESAS
jgi:PAS domain S-box-containing protein